MENKGEKSEQMQIRLIIIICHNNITVNVKCQCVDETWCWFDGDSKNLIEFSLFSSNIEKKTLIWMIKIV